MKAINISEHLEFTALGKTVRFTAQVKHLAETLIQLLAQGGDAEAVGELLASYLSSTLISAFDWQAGPSYERFILAGSEKQQVTLMALIWPENTFSPVHYHQAWCVFGVHKGALTETTYEPDATRHYPEGAWGYDHSGEGYNHKLGNAGKNTVVSFHIYGVSPDNLHRINCIVKGRD